MGALQSTTLTYRHGPLEGVVALLHSTPPDVLSFDPEYSYLTELWALFASMMVERGRYIQHPLQGLAGVSHHFHGMLHEPFGRHVIIREHSRELAIHGEMFHEPGFVIDSYIHQVYMTPSALYLWMALPGGVTSISDLPRVLERLLFKKLLMLAATMRSVFDLEPTYSQRRHAVGFALAECMCEAKRYVTNKLNLPELVGTPLHHVHRWGMKLDDETGLPPAVHARANALRAMWYIMFDLAADSETM